MLSVLLAVASSAPEGLNATENGPGPVAKGEPGTGVSAPAELTENTDTVLSLLLAVASSAPEGLNATDTGAKPPVWNGDPDTGVNAAEANAPAAADRKQTQTNPPSPATRRNARARVTFISLSHERRRTGRQTGGLTPLPRSRQGQQASQRSR